MMTDNDRMSWELAKSTVDGMAEPFGKDKYYLPNVNGYECSVHFSTHEEGKKVKQIILWNNKYRTSYAKYFNQRTSQEHSKNVFK